MTPIPRPGDSPNDTFKKLLWASLAANFGISSMTEYNQAVQNVIDVGGDPADFSQVVQNTPSGGSLSRVGGFTKVVSLPVLVSTSGAHAAGDVVVPPTKITGAFRPGVNSGVLHSITVSDESKQTAELIFVFWKTEPTGSAGANLPFDIPTLHQEDLQGIVKIETATFVTANLSTIASVSSVGLPLEATDDLWVTVFTSGTPTFVADKPFIIRFGILQD